jgi:protein transport protein SEC31
LLNFLFKIDPLLITFPYSNPYSDANRPGTAAAAVGITPKKAPISGSLDPNAVASLSGELKFVSDGLLSIAQELTAAASNAMEKKQASEAQKGVAVFIKASVRGCVDADVANKMQTMLSALQNRDYGSASSTMTSLVTHEWKDHRDWLKGMKILVQAASKKQI